MGSLFYFYSVGRVVGCWLLIYTCVSEDDVDTVELLLVVNEVLEGFFKVLRRVCWRLTLKKVLCQVASTETFFGNVEEASVKQLAVGDVCEV